MSAVGSRITLAWPSDPSFGAVGRLVVGGVAARVDLPVDRVEELGLALDTLARAVAPAGERLELEIEVARDALSLAVGPFAADPLVEPAVERVVTTLVDSAVTVAGGDGFRVVLGAGRAHGAG